MRSRSVRAWAPKSFSKSRQSHQSSTSDFQRAPSKQHSGSTFREFPCSSAGGDRSCAKGRDKSILVTGILILVVQSLHTVNTLSYWLGKVAKVGASFMFNFGRCGGLQKCAQLQNHF